MKNLVFERNFFNNNSPSIKLNKKFQYLSSNNIFDNYNLNNPNQSITNNINRKTQIEEFYSNLPSINKFNIREFESYSNSSRTKKKINLSENLIKLKRINEKIKKINNEEEKILPPISDLKKLIDNQNNLYYDLKKTLNYIPNSYEERKIKNLKLVSNKKKNKSRNYTNLYSESESNNDINQDYYNVIINNINIIRNDLNHQIDHLYKKSEDNYETLKKLLLKKQNNNQRHNIFMKKIFKTEIEDEKNNNNVKRNKSSEKNNDKVKRNKSSEKNNNKMKRNKSSESNNNNIKRNKSNESNNNNIKRNKSNECNNNNIKRNKSTEKNNNNIKRNKSTEKDNHNIKIIKSIEKNDSNNLENNKIKKMNYCGGNDIFNSDNKYDNKIKNTLNDEEEKKKNKRKSILNISKKLNKILKIKKNNNNKEKLKYKKKINLDLYEKMRLENIKTIKKIEEKLFLLNHKKKMKPKNKFRSYVYLVIAARRILNIKYIIHKEIKYNCIIYFIENYYDMDLILKKLVFFSIKDTFEDIISNKKITLDLISEKKNKEEIYLNLQKYLEKIIKGLNDNFFEGLNKKMKKYLSIFITNYSYIPSEFFTLFELVRFKTSLTGDLIDLNHNQRIMILGFYIIIKIMIKDLFLKMVFHQNIIDRLSKKIKSNIKIINSIIYRELIHLFIKNCDIKRNKNDIETMIDTQNFMKIEFHKKEFIIDKRIKHRNYSKERLKSSMGELKKKEKLNYNLNYNIFKYKNNNSTENEINNSKRKIKKLKLIRRSSNKKKSILKISSIEEFKINHKPKKSIKDLELNELNNFEKLSIKTNSNIAHRNKGTIIRKKSLTLNKDDFKNKKEEFIKDFSDENIKDMENLIENMETYDDDIEIEDVLFFDNVLYDNIDLKDFYKFAQKNSFNPLIDLKQFLEKIIFVIQDNFS